MIDFDASGYHTIVQGNVHLQGGAILGASYNGWWLGAHIAPKIQYEESDVTQAIIGLDWIWYHCQFVLFTAGQEWLLRPVGADVGVASNYPVEWPALVEVEIDGDINAPAVVCCMDVSSDKTCLKSLLCGEWHKCIRKLL